MRHAGGMLATTLLSVACASPGTEAPEAGTVVADQVAETSDSCEAVVQDEL